MSIDTQLNNPRILKVFCPRQAASDSFVNFTRGSSSKNRRMFLFKTLHDFDDMIDAFSLAEDHFGKTLAQRSMMIKSRKAEILIRQIAQSLNRAFDGARSFTHLC